MLIDILALDGVFDTGLAAVQDTLAIAAELGREQRGVSAPLLTRVVGVRRGVTTANGLKVPTQMASALSRPDVIVVPALGAKTPQTLAGALGHRDVARAGALLRDRQTEGVIAASACTGTFVLAESGLLDGRKATTSWWLGPFFRARYPKVVLDDGRMVVRSGDVVTAGDRLPAVGADRLGYDFGRALVVSAAVDIPAAVVDYDGSTLGREVARVGAAQAASGTRDYRNTA